MKCVLDTNVVLDWLVFDDSLLKILHLAVRESRVIIVTHPSAIEELRRVLDYPQLALDPSLKRTVLQTYESHTSQPSSAQPQPLERADLPKGFPRCRDADDDHFLALAYRSGADALISRDNAVLALKRRSEKFGFKIMNVQQLNATLQRV